MVVYVVDTEDGESYFFSTREKQVKFANKITLEYAEETGLALAECGDFCHLSTEQVDRFE